MLSQPTQQIFSLDARSAWLWCCVEEGLDESEIVTLYAEDFGVSAADADHDVGEIVEKLRQMLQSPLAIPSAADASGNNEYGDALPDQVHRSRVRLLGTVFDVTFPSETLCERFRSTMGHLEDGGPDTDVEVVVAARGDEFAVVIGGTVVETASSPLEIASQVKSALCHAAINRQPFDACLHAALVDMAGRSILLPAESGSGKSCLALSLAGAGAECLSDDLTLLDLDSLTVRGVPAASCVKADAWETISAIHPALRSAPAHRRVDGKLVKYLPVAQPSEAGCPASLIVFPTFRKGLETRLVPLPPGEALRRLLASVLAWRAHLTPATLDGIIAWIEATPCYELWYGSSRDAVAIIGTIIDRRSGEAMPCPSS